jgi:hypothetical protein
MPTKRILSKKSSKKVPRKKKPRIERDSYHLPIRTEEEQLEGLSDDLLDAWHALRSFCASLGDQEIRTSHRSIMFARKTCYLFVRPKKRFIEVNLFLEQALQSELIKKVSSVSKTKYVHVLELVHSDQVDQPLTDWIKEAFQISEF